MSSIGKILSHAVDGMSAQTNALSSTSSNIVNATTPGFVRRRIITESLPSGGVRALMPVRPVDRFAESNVLAQAGYFASADTRASYLGRLQSLVAPANGSINEKVQAFFSAYTALSAAPADTVLRATALSRAQDVAAGFNSAARGVGTMRADLYVQADQLIGEVNDRTQKIAKLNIQIAAMEGAGQSAADLRDTRDVLVREVAERTGATSIEDSSGAVTLLAMGTSLVEKGFASQLALKTTTNDPEMKMRVVSTRPSGQDNDITSQISSGTLAALIESRDVAALRTVKDLDEFAFDFMKAVNDIHSQGVGLDLATPASSTQRFNLFTSAGTTATGAAGSMKLVDTVAANPRLLATTSDVKLVPAGNDVALKIAALSREGLTSINGVPGPSAADRFGNMAGNIGSLIVSAQSDYRLRESTLAQAERLKESASGVSIEEEMANLTQFQRAFDASAKVMRTADELLQTLLQAVG